MVAEQQQNTQHGAQVHPCRTITEERQTVFLQQNELKTNKKIKQLVRWSDGITMKLIKPCLLRSLQTPTFLESEEEIVIVSENKKKEKD